ncbi:Putative transposase (identified by ISEscan HMM) [Klebsiella pneumoniae]|nr:Putative transposase (identified by ISEscan HMM) [Klebsiella pneumoniae]
MWLREQMQQTSQCWTLKELAKISGIAPEHRTQE